MARIIIDRIICDRCKKQTDFVLTKEKFEKVGFDATSTWYPYSYEENYGHLCESCNNELKAIKAKFFENKGENKK